MTYEMDGIPFNGNLLLYCSDAGAHTVTVTATDADGNSSFCNAEILVEDKLPPFVQCTGDTTVILPPQGIILVDEFMIAQIFDNCPLDTLNYTYILNSVVTGDSLWLDCSNVGIDNLVIMEVEDPVTGDITFCTSMVQVVDTGTVCTPIEITGTVFQDSIDNCLFDAQETGIGPIEVAVTNLQTNVTSTTLADASGNYTYTGAYNSGLPNADFEISAVVPDYAQTCGTPLLLSVPPGANSAQQDIPVQITDECAYLQVDLGAPFLRKCNENTLIVSYCNYSLLLIEDTYVEVTLDPVQHYLSSSIPFSGSSGNTYTFDLGDVDPLGCGSFTINVTDSCNTVVGQTLCMEAHIYPDEICDPQASPDWDGASIEIDKSCDGSNLKFTIKNVGAGDMDAPLSYFIVEDVVMYMEEDFQLNAGESVDIDLPADGTTWRIEAEQASGHPGLHQPIAWYEGCGGINTTGLVNLFPVNNNDPFLSIYCDEVLAPLDPNDKRGFPYGRDDEHFISPNQDIEYFIRFQNVGNDTAFQVVILDTLSELLNPATIRPGASSHPYSFHIDQAGVVRFTFANIQLPDSTTNEVASHGFVKFRIAQQADLPEGSVILNEAGIYFDQEAPVITNQTWHTIGEPFLINSVRTAALPDLQVQLSPNPFEQMVQFELSGLPSYQGRLLLYDLQGRLRRQIEVQSPQFKLYRGNLEAGMYIYQLEINGEEAAQGKLIVR
ncbi:MAG: T9SS type A sorting domain-containing protein [Phaeodactylibacter sp.]|nr:T9SS type A sorting domain-containing protein [Phaeodactylibacter sp.]